MNAEHAEHTERHRRLRKSDLLHFIAGHPGDTVAEADAALTNRPRFFTDLNIELVHELYLGGWLMLDSASSAQTRLTATAAPVDRDLRPSPAWDCRPRPAA